MRRRGLQIVTKTRPAHSLRQELGGSILVLVISKGNAHRSNKTATAACPKHKQNKGSNERQPTPPTSKPKERALQQDDNRSVSKHELVNPFLRHGSVGVTQNGVKEAAMEQQE